MTGGEAVPGLQDQDKFFLLTLSSFLMPLPHASFLLPPASCLLPPASCLPPGHLVTVKVSVRQSPMRGPSEVVQATLSVLAPQVKG